MIALFLIIVGLTLLLLGSRGVISNAIRISALTKIPPFIVGVTIVAIGTSLPEMVVSFFGGLEKASGLALGNIIGSNIANIGLILGISLLMHPIYIGRTSTQKNMLVTLIVGLLLFITLLIDGITIAHGVFFVIVGFGVIIWQIVQGKNDGLVDEQTAQLPKNPALTILFFLASLFCLFLGGKFLVDGGVAIATLFHIPEVIIGITVLAVGTSLPELAVSITALAKHVTKAEQKLVVGNILGSNIFNILFGAGMLGIFGVKHFNSSVSLYALLIFTLVLGLLIYLFRGKTIPQYIGAGLVFSYVLYLILLFLSV